MIDIHCHFLPGIDDGPDTMAEAVALARIALADGITHSIVTPHIHPGRWENEASSIRNAVAVFRDALKAEAVALKISFAAEVRLSDFIFKQLELLQLPFLGTLAGYSLLLLEFPHGQLIPGSDQLAAWLMKKAIRPVIAHPERNKSIMRDPGLLKPFLKSGCLLQVTAGSLTGKFGSKAQEIARQLLEQDQISFVATDAHNIKARPPILSEAFALVSSLKGPECAARLFGGNQQEFLAASGEGSGLMSNHARLTMVPVLLLLAWQCVFAVQVLVSDVLNFSVQRAVIFWGTADNKPAPDEVAKAREQIGSALRLWPQNPDYLALLARLYAWQGQTAGRSAANEQYKLAIATMHKSLEQRAGNPYSWAQYAEYLATQRDKRIELDIAVERVRLLGAGDQKLQQRMQALVRH